MWQLRTVNSPYRLDQVEVDMQIRDRTVEILRERKLRKQRKKQVARMDGIPDVSFLTEDFVSSVGIEEKHAIKHLVLLKKLQTLKAEKYKLSKMVDEECDLIERRFVKIAMQRSAERFKLNSIPRVGSASFADNTDDDTNMWGNVSSQKMSSEQVRALRAIDTRVYNAEGRYDESGQFHFAVTAAERAGLMSAKYAQVAGRVSPKLMSRPEEIEKF